MPQDESDRDEQQSEQHAQWVREHPRIEESGFPEYPDDPSRRGSSRGATPNGNPWRPVDPDERPGRKDLDQDLGRISSPPDSDCVPTERVIRTPPPPPEVDQTPAVVIADSLADERIGRDIGDVLASAKALEGFHVLVEVTDGEVYLSGTVADQTVRSEVERLSSSVRGAKRIHNELEVRH
jgi:hypothetical protein